VNAWVTLVAAVAGAAIALAGQHVAKRGETRTRRGELLLEQCAQVVALSDEFRSRVWEEAKLGKQGQVDAWDLGGYRLAAARIRILSDDASLVAALEELTNSGKQLGAYWRRGKVDLDELQSRRELDKVACSDFVQVSQIVVKRYLGEHN
jgi:hypothetical protein